MKRILVWGILIVSIVFMVGCEKKGYIVIIETSQIGYDDLEQIRRMLEDKSFKAVFLERKKDIPRYPNEVYTLFEKKLSNKWYIVDVSLNYIKDGPNNIARSIRIDIHNIYKGMSITELRDEIDKVGDLIYRELLAKVGKENVIIERKETQQRLIFF